MFRQVNFYLLGVVSLCAVLIIGVNGCGQDEANEWLGTWTLETVDGESIQAQFEAIELLFESFAEAFGEDETNIDISYTDEWTFDDDGAWDRGVTIVAPNEDDIIETISVESMGTYSLSGSNYTIIVEGSTDYTITVEGTVTEEGSGDFEVKVDAGPELGDTETGTWSIQGNTLTLTSDNGYVLGFKKK